MALGEHSERVIPLQRGHGLCPRSTVLNVFTILQFGFDNSVYPLNVYCFYCSLVGFYLRKAAGSNLLSVFRSLEHFICFHSLLYLKLATTLLQWLILRVKTVQQAYSERYLRYLSQWLFSGPRNSLIFLQTKADLQIAH